MCSFVYLREMINSGE